MTSHALQYNEAEVDRIVAARAAKRQRTGFATPWGEQKVRGDYERIGVAGEVAFAEMYGVPVDERDFGTGHGDGGIDFDTIIGTVDVKTTGKRDGDLKVRHHAKLHPDFYFLASYDRKWERATLVGWVSRAEVEAAAIVVEGDHKNYVVPRIELRSPGEFAALLQRKRETWLRSIAA